MNHLKLTENTARIDAIFSAMSVSTGLFSPDLTEDCTIAALTDKDKQPIPGVPYQRRFKDGTTAESYGDIHQFLSSFEDDTNRDIYYLSNDGLFVYVGRISEDNLHVYISEEMSDKYEQLQLTGSL